MRSFFDRIGLLFCCLLLAVFVVIHYSCNSDKCNVVNCVNGGTCGAGACTCVTGYQGPLCETVSTTNFIGAWNVWDSGTLYGPVYYFLGIHQGPAIANMCIDSLYNYYFTGPINAYISGSDTFVIAPQIMLGKSVQGTGYFYNTQQVVVNYQVTDIATNTVDYRIMTWKK